MCFALSKSKSKGRQNRSHCFFFSTRVLINWNCSNILPLVYSNQWINLIFLQCSVIVDLINLECFFQRLDIKVLFHFRNYLLSLNWSILYLIVVFVSFKLNLFFSLHFFKLQIWFFWLKFCLNLFSFQKLVIFCLLLPCPYTVS